jgi:hypothetical protein
MLQGIVAEMLIGNDIFREQGWMSRILISWPESTVGSRPYIEEDIFSDESVKKYHTACLALLDNTPLNPERRLDPPVLVMSQVAKRVWIQFHNYCDKEAAHGGELETARGMASKAPEHAARLAGILSVMRGGTEISIEDIEAGITLANYYLAEAVRIAVAGQINQPLKDAEQLRQWIMEKGLNRIYPALVYQKGPGKLRTKDKALKAIRTLEDHGWLLPMDIAEIDGSYRREVWRFNNV